MGTFKDLTGKRFNRLVAIRPIKSPSGGYVWECKCDCGKITLQRAYSLEHDIVKSCGCLNRELASALMKKDLTGQKFGRLTALYNTGKKSNNCYVWHCKCECGKEIDVQTNSLTTGGTRSCGCLFHKELAGRRFGRLTVISKTDKRDGSNVVWKCKCDCGNECEVPSCSLLRGSTTSCGCYRIERIKETNTKWTTKEEHMLAGILHNIKQRCLNPNDCNAENYIERGITICDEWANDDGTAFVTWALSHGWKPGLTIERTRNDEGYSPENCICANKKVQGNNRRSNRHLTIDGMTHTIAQWADISGVDPNDLWGKSDTTILERLSSFIQARRSAKIIPKDIRQGQLGRIEEMIRRKEIIDPFIVEAYDLNP